MRTMPIACAALLVAIATAAASPDVHAGTEACVVYSEVPHPDSRTLDVHIANTCNKPFACSVAWTVTCGKATRVTRNVATLAGSAERSWVASAASCDSDWSIDTNWTCKPSR